MGSIRVFESAWPTIEQSLKDGSIALLPIGAACKQHGRHLPCNTDFRQVDWLVEELIARTNLVVRPELGYGYYPAFTDYPGSISLSREPYAQLVAEVLDGIEEAGARKMVILNTGVSTIQPLERTL